MAADDAAVTVSLRADLKGYEAALKSAVRATEKAAKAAETAISGVGKGAKPNFAPLNDNFRQSAAQIQNDARIMQFQLNDVFSGLASGQGVRALQMQLGQIAQQMSGQSLRQGAATMGAALAGMVNPINLAVVAFGVLASVAASYFSDTEKDAAKAREELEKQADAIKKLADAYGTLFPELDRLAKAQRQAADAAAAAEARQTAISGAYAKTQKTVDSLAPGIEEITGLLQLLGASAEDIDKLGSTFDNLDKKTQDFTATSDDAKAVMAALDEIIAHSTGRVAELAKAMRDQLAASLAEMDRAARSAGEALPVVTGSIEDLTQALKALLSLDPSGLGAIILMLQQQFPDALAAAKAALGDFGALIGTTLKDVGSATDLIKYFEKFSSTAYWDVNAFRVGFGSDTFVDDMGKIQKVTKDTVVTLQQANADLARRIGEFQGTIVRQIGSDVWTNLLESQKAALTSIAYNYGSLPDSIVAALKAGDMGKVATAIANLSTNPKRRQEEAELFARGSFPAKQALETADATAKANENLQQYLRSLDEQASLQTRINEINTTGTLNADQKRIAIEVETELQKALNQARQDGITLTDSDIAKIREKAAANAMAGNAAIAISEAEKAAAKEAADAAAAAKKEAMDQAQALQNLANTLASMATGALTGFVQDLRNGTDAAEALYNAVSRIADQLLQMALNMMFQKLFGSLLGVAGGGLGGGLFASGGYTGDRSTRAPAGIVHGQEFVVNAQATKRHRALLESINKGVPGYASGGFVLPRMSQAATSQQAAPQVNTRTTVVNTFDAGSFLSEAMSRPAGVNVILNAIRSQPGAFRQAIQG